jgi:hypothetical protein
MSTFAGHWGVRAVFFAFQDTTFSPPVFYPPLSHSERVDWTAIGRVAYVSNGHVAEFNEPHLTGNLLGDPKADARLDP